MIRSITKQEADALKAKAAPVDAFPNPRLVEVHATPEGPVTLIFDGDRILAVERDEADFIPDA